MRRFFSNCRGAVTVIVTLILVPSLLVTGTGVDVARSFVAKSTLADADSLAANAALADYNGLLQDLYGLYAIEDTTLQGMLDDYIRLAVFSDDDTEKGLGTYQLFYGKETELASTLKTDKSLGDLEVLRRQIEQYMMLRGPVVLADKVMKIIDSMGKLNADSEAIKEKLDIDDGLEELNKIYEQIYDKINEVNEFADKHKQDILDINEKIGDIKSFFIELIQVRNGYTAAIDRNAGIDEIQFWADLYDLKMDRVTDCVKGKGLLSINYHSYADYFEAVGEYDGDKSSLTVSESARYSGTKSLKELFSDGKKHAEDAKKAMEELVKLCHKADSKKAELSQKVDNLERRLQGDSCSENLKEGMAGAKSFGTTSDPKTMIEAYRDALKYDTEDLAKAMQDQDLPAVTKAIELLESSQCGYGVRSQMDNPDYFLVYNSLLDIESNRGFDIRLELDNRNTNHKTVDVLKNCCGPTMSAYELKAVDGFLTYQNCSQQHRNFYNILSQWFSGSEKKAKASKATTEKAVEALIKKAKDLIGGLSNDPEGAYYYSGQAKPSATEEGFDTGADSKEWKKKAKSSMDSSFLASLGDMIASAGDKLLLVTYDIEMFSHYATGRTDRESVSKKSLTGVPFGIPVNYFYQSEQEYLYQGSFDAATNLSAVTGLIFLVRFVLNYIVSFSIAEVQQMVLTVKTTLAPLGFIAEVVGELVRLGLALAQTAWDVSDLRNGYLVPLMHTDETWTMSLSGMTEETLETIGEISRNASGLPPQNDDTGFGYEVYMAVFLLFRDGNTLAERTKTLLELNLTNYKNKGALISQENNGPREKAMAKIARENLDNYAVSFSLTSSIEMDTFFFIMPAAQKGIDGVVPPKTMTITDTTYRGY